MITLVKISSFELERYLRFHACLLLLRLWLGSSTFELFRAGKVCFVFLVL
jgi:hypothetical protein